MESTVTINFAGGTASTQLVQIFVQGAEIGLGITAGVTLTAPLTNLSIQPGVVAIASPIGGRYDGRIALLLQWSGNDPTVALNNLVPAGGGPATVSWPTATGPETQALTPGTPITLNGLVGG